MPAVRSTCMIHSPPALMVIDHNAVPFNCGTHLDDGVLISSSNSDLMCLQHAASCFYTKRSEPKSAFPAKGLYTKASSQAQEKVKSFKDISAGKTSTFRRLGLTRILSSGVPCRNMTKNPFYKCSGTSSCRSDGTMAKIHGSLKCKLNCVKNTNRSYSKNVFSRNKKARRS